MAHSFWLWLETQTEMYWVRVLVGSDGYHRGFAYTVLQTAQGPGVCSQCDIIMTVQKR